MGARRVACPVVVLAAAVALHCTPAGLFPCDQDADCLNGSVQGTCESVGFCSFPDDDCPSGARFGAHAGEGLAGECVAPLVGTDATSVADSSAGPDTEATTTPVSASGDASTVGGSTGPGDPACGDGNQDPGEQCDDANTVDGDGCNNDCVISGSLLWLDVFDGAGGFNDNGYAITVTGAGQAATIGYQANGGGDDDVLIRQFDAAGQVVFTLGFDVSGGGLDVGFGVAEAAPGQYAVAARIPNPSDAMLDAAYVAVHAADGAVWSETRTVVGDDVNARGIVVATDGAVVVAGSEGSAGYAAKYSSSGMQQWRVGPLVSAAPEVAHAIAIDANDDVYVAGWFDPGDGSEDIFLAKVSAGGGQPWVRTHTTAGSINDRAHGVAVSADGTIYVAGREATVDSRQVWLRAYDAAGEALWTSTEADAAGRDCELLGAGVAPDGTVVGVGWIEFSEGNDDPWLGKWDSDGELMWGRILGEFAGPGWDWGWDVDVLPSGEIVVVGHQTNISRDYVVAAFAP